MSKVLVIPDTHLKSKIFDLADKILETHEVDYVVQLGDNIDDFYCYEEEYKAHNARMLIFKLGHPETVWLWGNHELSYILNRPVTGNIHAGAKYAQLYKENFNPKLVHIDGKVIFSHAGVFQNFLESVNLDKFKKAETVIKKLNKLDLKKVWSDNSPVWARHKYEDFQEPDALKNYIQVIGHTPEETIYAAKCNIYSKERTIITTDVFSTDWGRQYGEEKLIIIDTNTGEWEKIGIDYRKTFDV